MAEENPEATQAPTDSTQVSESLAAPAEAMTDSEAQAPQTEVATEPTPAVTSPETSTARNDAAAPAEPPSQQEPDVIQPYIDKAFETIQHEVSNEELSKFLRAHIKTFREEWDALSDTAKDAYVHMMTSQLVQRKAASTRIKIYEEFKLPVPSAQTTLFESIKQSQVKPKKRQPVLLMPPNLRPTYSLKK